MSLSRLCCGLFALMCMAAPCFADETLSYRAGERPGTWRGEPSAWGQDQWEIGLAFNTMYGGTLNRKSILGLGGQIIYHFFDMYSLGLAFDGYRASSDDPLRDDFNIVAGSLSCRVHVSIARAFPAFYGGVGMGLYGLDDSDDSNRALFQATLGVEYAVFYPFSLFTEYRYAFRDIRFKGDNTHGLFRFGVNYAF